MKPGLCVCVCVYFQCLSNYVNTRAKVSRSYFIRAQWPHHMELNAWYKGGRKRDVQLDCNLPKMITISHESHMRWTFFCLLFQFATLFPVEAWNEKLAINSISRIQVKLTFHFSLLLTWNFTPCMCVCVWLYLNSKHFSVCVCVWLLCATFHFISLSYTQVNLSCIMIGNQKKAG